MTINWDDLNPEVQEMLEDEAKRTGEDVWEVLERILLEEGRRRFPKPQ